MRAGSLRKIHDGRQWLDVTWALFHWRGACASRQGRIRALSVSQDTTTMKISMYTMAAEQNARMLGNLSGLLDKGIAHAEAKKFEAGVLVGARIAPDMFPLSRQVQIACDIVKNGVARLAGQEAPRFEDNEQTMQELKARVAKTLDFVKSVPAAALEGSEDRDIKIPLRDRAIEMKGLQYLRGFVLPNFYFHLTMTYALLRHNGVELGKQDFLGALT
jgi:uncharacterized protein